MKVPSPVSTGQTIRRNRYSSEYLQLVHCGDYSALFSQHSNRHRLVATWADAHPTSDGCGTNTSDFFLDLDRAVTGSGLLQRDRHRTGCACRPLQASAFGSATILLTSISVQKLESSTTLVAGGPVTYSIVVTNTGQVTVTGVTVTDTLAPIVLSATASEPSGFPTPIVFWRGFGYAVCVVRHPYPWSFQVVYIYDQRTAGHGCGPTDVSDTAYVTAQTIFSSPNLATSMFSNGVYATGLPLSTGLSVTKIVTSATPSPGDLVRYRIVIRNSGQMTITSLAVVDTISPIVMLSATSGDQPPGWAPAALTGGASATRLSWSRTGFILGPGSSLPLRFLAMSAVDVCRRLFQTPSMSLGQAHARRQR